MIRSDKILMGVLEFLEEKAPNPISEREIFQIFGNINLNARYMNQVADKQWVISGAGQDHLRFLKREELSEIQTKILSNQTFILFETNKIYKVLVILTAILAVASILQTFKSFFSMEIFGKYQDGALLIIFIILIIGFGIAIKYLLNTKREEI